MGRRFLDDAAGFYKMIDAVVTPLEFSAGSKIKVGEALAWNVPVLATWDAFDGVRAYHPNPQAPTVHTLREPVVSVANGRRARMGDGKAALGAAVDNQLVGACGLRIPAIADLLEPTGTRPSA